METAQSNNEFIQLADNLDRLNKHLNNGQGSSVAALLIDDLQRGDIFEARIDATQQSDKFGDFPELQDWAKTHLFQDYKNPWETRYDFYERLSRKKIISIDPRFDENKDTPKGVSQILLHKGYQEWNPPINLTKTAFSTDGARFKTVDVRSSEEALSEVLKEAGELSGKRFIGKVIVKTLEGGQKEAVVFVRPEVTRINIRDGFDGGGLSIWQESDGAMVAKLQAVMLGSKESIDFTILKRAFPDIENRIKAENEGSRKVDKIPSDNPDYFVFRFDYSHNWNLVFPRLFTRSDTLVSRIIIGQWLIPRHFSLQRV